MNLSFLVGLNFLACQDTAETEVELDEIRAQLYQQQLIIEDLQS